MLAVWALGSTIVGRAFTALAESEGDAQLFSYIGLRWLHGSVLYVDIWDNKPPGIFAAIAAVFSVWPKSFVALAACETVVVLGCIATASLITIKLRAPQDVTALCVILVSAAANLTFYNEGGNLTEVYVLWPATLSIYLFIAGIPLLDTRLIFFAGACAGIASWFKPVGLAPFLAQSVFLAADCALFRKTSLRDLCRAWLANCCGVLAAWLPWLWYFYSHGALGEFFYSNTYFNFAYGRTVIPAFRGLAATVPEPRIHPYAGLAACALAGVLSWWLTLKRRDAPGGQSSLTRIWPLIALWVLADFAGAAAGGRSYRHYFLPLAPSLAVGATLTYWSLAAFFTETSTRKVGSVVLFAMIAGPLLFVQAGDLKQIARVAAGRRYIELRPWEFASSFIHGRARSGDTLFVWNYMPGIYFRTGMKSPTALICADRLIAVRSARQRYGAMLLSDLSTKRPRFIVYDPGRTLTPTDDWVHAGFRRLLVERYAIAFEMGGIRVYEIDAAD